MTYGYEWDKARSEYYRFAPKTIVVIDNSSSYTYTIDSTRENKLHMLTTTVPIRVERSATAPVVSTLSGIWQPSDGPLYFRLDELHHSLGVSRFDGLPFGNGGYVSIFLVDRDNNADVPLKTLVDPSNGTFTRSSAGNYFTSANTIASQPANTRRFETLGDVATPLLLIEGAHTNLITQSNNYAAWVQPAGGGTGVSNTALSPDGTVNAGTFDMQLAAASKFGPQIAATMTAGQSYYIQCFGKAASLGSVGFPFRLRAGGPGISATVNPTESWKFFSGGGTVTTTSVVEATGVANTPNTGDPAFSQWSAYMYGCQLTNTPHETSLVNTAGTTATCGADVLTYTNAEYDSELCTKGGIFTFYPKYSSLEFPRFDNKYFLSFGSPSDRFMFESGSSTIYIRVVQGNVTRLQTNPMTWNKNARISLTIEPNNGKLTIAGVTGGGGTYTFTPFSWPYTNLRVGGGYSAAGELYARIEPIYNVR